MFSIKPCHLGISSFRISLIRRCCATVDRPLIDRIAILLWGCLCVLKGVGLDVDGEHGPAAAAGVLDVHHTVGQGALNQRSDVLFFGGGGQATDQRTGSNSETCKHLCRSMAFNLSLLVFKQECSTIDLRFDGRVRVVEIKQGDCYTIRCLNKLGRSLINITRDTHKLNDLFRQGHLAFILRVW